MIRQAQAARLEFRLQRLGGEWESVSVRFVHSHKALNGALVSFAGPGFYLYKDERWRWLAKHHPGADARVRQIEAGDVPKPPPPTPAEVFGVVLQVVGAIFGVVKAIPKRGK